jgi:acyl-CoA dehydrogenase
VNFQTDNEFDEVRDAVRKLCERFPSSYWLSLEPDRYPSEFVAELTKHGWLAALIPEEYGGGGTSLAGACVIMEEIAASGANPAACHAQMYVMGTLLRHGSDAQKDAYLPKIAAGELRLQAFGVSEAEAGSDTPRLRTRADKTSDGYRVHGRKMWISRAAHSDLMILLARTTPLSQVTRRTDGLSVFLIDLRDAGSAVTITPIPMMMNHSTTEIVFDGLDIPAEALIGDEGKGFRYILDGMNAERTLIASECIGDGRFFLDKAVAYAKERVVFERPIGANQGVQFPLARAHLAVQAAALMRDKAARQYDQGLDCGAEASGAKLMASEASWLAGNACIDVHGGMGFAVETDVERKFRETRLYQTAPISNNLVLAHIAHNVLKLPRSY